MDFLDPHKRRAHTIRLFIGYALVGIALLFATIILVMLAYGFDFNRKTGSVIHNGLVFVDAKPESAEIFLNGEAQGNTDNRLVIPEGDYAIELRRSGYRSWKKSFKLEGGSIERLVYPVLFPEKLTTTDVQVYDGLPTLETQSPDRRWLVLQFGNNSSAWELFDLNTGNSPRTVMALPGVLFSSSGVSHNYEVVEWSSDNRRFLVKHSYDSNYEYVIVDRESPSSSQNLTKLFSQTTAQFSLRDKKYDQYYMHDATSLVLSTIDLNTRSAIKLLDGVTNYKSHGADTLIFSTVSTTDSQKTDVKLRSGQEVYKLREITRSDTHALEITRFDDHWFMAVVSPKESKTYIFRDPINQIKRETDKLPPPVAALKLDDPKHLSLSKNNRFIAVQSGSKFAVYDAEEIRLLHFDTKLEKIAQTAEWMDGFRLSVVVEGSLRVFDFDGNNLQKLVATDDSSLAFFDKDYETIYSLGSSLSSKDKKSLSTTALKVKN